MKDGESGYLYKYAIKKSWDNPYIWLCPQPVSEFENNTLIECHTPYLHIWITAARLNKCSKGWIEHHGMIQLEQFDNIWRTKL